jgi:hypothetical protein
MVEVVFSDRDPVSLEWFRSHVYRTKEACFNSYGPRCVVQQLESRKQYIRIQADCLYREETRSRRSMAMLGGS